MALKEDLANEVAEIFRQQWTTRKGTVVPDPSALKLSNDGVELDGTVLYADLSGSTTMVDSLRPQNAAELYKAYLHCAAKIIRSEGGTITAYDGDRVMAVYLGDTKNTSAARTALKINFAVRSIINPAYNHIYGATSPFTIKQVVGIDTSSLLVARVGVRGDNDLVWVGRAANYAAKLTSLPDDYPTWITKAVYDRLMDEAKYGGTERKPMWEARLWTAMGNAAIYCSNWWWTV